MQVHKRGAHLGEEPTLGLDYEGRVFQMFRGEDKCVAAMLRSYRLPAQTVDR